MLGRLFGEFFVFFCLILSIFVLFMFNCVDTCFVCFRFMCLRFFICVLWRFYVVLVG